MTPTLQVRRAKLTDAAVITEYNRRLAWETEHLELDLATVAAGVVGVLSDPVKGFYFVAEKEGRVVGQCSVTFEWSDWRNGMFWWLQSVYVESTERGAGVFRQLHRAVEEEALAAGAIGLRLYVEAENRAAQEVYRRRGMTETPYRVFEALFPAKTHEWAGPEGV